MKIIEDIQDDYKITYILGRNAKENHQLIDDSDQNDWWIHISDFPSGHCVIRKENIVIENQNKIESLEPNIKEILTACDIVRENSKFKNQKDLQFCYTQIKNLKKTKKPGEVIILKKKFLNTIKL